MLIEYIMYPISIYTFSIYVICSDIMPIFIPKWILRRLITLWRSYHDKDFTFEEAQNALDDDSRIVALVLSQLKNSGWVESRPDPNDSRRKLYNILNGDIVSKMMKIEVEG